MVFSVWIDNSYRFWRTLTTIMITDDILKLVKFMATGGECLLSSNYIKIVFDIYYLLASRPLTSCAILLNRFFHYRTVSFMKCKTTLISCAIRNGKGVKLSSANYLLFPSTWLCVSFREWYNRVIMRFLSGRWRLRQVQRHAEAFTEGITHWLLLCNFPSTHWYGNCAALTVRLFFMIKEASNMASVSIVMATWIRLHGFLFKESSHFWKLAHWYNGTHIQFKTWISLSRNN